ncbi:IQ-DOMAIN 14-like protein [Tanacetum coccineum]|uniref:IQ-DOMAIN 14-like protein n=1 Tax=Tanacetum coccineum TaxID=301880 RepID=A0ABQ5FW57_9ASTR
MQLVCGRPTVYTTADAADVVRLTSDSRGTLFSGREKWAATKIQSVYRGHLARRALRALRGVVKFQALVKGFVVRKRVAATLYSMQALLRAQLGVRSQRAHRSFKDHRVQPEICHQKSTERFDNDTRSEIHSKRLSTSYDSIKNSYDERPKIAGMDPYRPHGQSRRNHYQDPERGFTGKDYKCSKTTRSTPRVAYSNRSNTQTRPPKSVCRDAFSRPYLNRPGYMANTQSFSAKPKGHVCVIEIDDRVLVYDSNSIRTGIDESLRTPVAEE